MIGFFLEIDQGSKQKDKEGSRTIQPSIEGLWLLCTGFSMKCYFITLKKNKYKNVHKIIIYFSNLILTIN